jgi:hypothetical protein
MHKTGMKIMHRTWSLMPIAVSMPTISAAAQKRRAAKYKIGPLGQARRTASRWAQDRFRIRGFSQPTAERQTT